MKGDKLVIEPHHVAMAEELAEVIALELPRPGVITVAGESGAGKTELGSELARALSERGIPSTVLHQDDYFVFPPKTNHRMREANIDQVGLFEVKLGLLDSNLRSFKRGESPIYRPLVDYDADSIEFEELEVNDVRAIVAEGTYTTPLRHADLRIFINRTYDDTRAHREARAREPLSEFLDQVLRREHDIISRHRELADFVIASSFDAWSRGSPD